MKEKYIRASDFFVAQLGSQNRPEQLFRVTRTSAQGCELAGRWDQPSARVPGRVRRDPLGPPVVGDWVVVENHPGGAVVERVLERCTVIARRAQSGRKRRGQAIQRQIIASNVDVVFIVTGLDADFSPRRIERYLVLAHDGGVRPVVLLTKRSLVEDAEAKLAAAAAVSPGVDVHAIDVVAGLGVDLPASYATEGVTVAMLGSSGAGKSTLVNHLLCDQRMPTASVRTSDDKGRHTTTHRELTFTPQGAAVIDNPGMRELSLWVEGEGLSEAFVDVGEHAEQCRFSDCTHTHEPGCAVKGAVEAGELLEDRLDSFLDLKAEVAATELRRDERRRRAEDRKFGKLYRAVQRANRKRR